MVLPSSLGGIIDVFGFGISKMLKFYNVSFLCDRQGAVMHAIL